MGKIVPDLTGDLRRGAFYGFNVQFHDDLTPEIPDRDWIIASRTPTADQLIDAGRDSYLYLEDLPEADDRVEQRDCPADPKHVTFHYYKRAVADALGGTRVSPF